MAAPKNHGAKAPKREGTRANLLLDTEAYERLGTHALMLRQTGGEIVSRLINEYLKEYALPAKLSERSSKSHRANPVVPVIETAGPLPCPSLS